MKLTYRGQIYFSREKLVLAMWPRVYNIRIYHKCEGKDRKIRTEDRRLASRGLPRDAKR